MSNVKENATQRVVVPMEQHSNKQKKAAVDPVILKAPAQ